MAKTEAVPETELLTMESCVAYIRTNYNVEYPVNTKKRHTFGNIPDALHEKIMKFAGERNLRIAEAIAALWDFYAEYEAEFENELKAQRAKPKKRRG